MPNEQMLLNGLDLLSVVRTYLTTPISEPEALPLGPKDPEIESAEQERWQLDRAPYRDAHAGRVTLHLDQLRHILEQDAPARQTAEREQAKYVQQQIKDLGTLETAYDIKELALNEARGRLREEYERLARLPNVRAVRIDQRELVVETNDLIMTIHDRKITRWNVGPWAIHIPRNNDIRNIRCLSLRSRVRTDRAGWIHPHVDPGGKICWGNLETTLYAAAQTAQYDVVAELVLAILSEGRKYETRDGGNGAGHNYGLRLMDVGDQVG